MIFAITGNPGVGKHTIAREISNRLNLAVLDINEIAKSECMLEENEDTHDIDVEKLQDILEEKITNSCLIVGHLAPYVLNPEKIQKVIVLRRDPYDLLDVYKKRGYSQKKAKENAGSEVLGIIMFDAVERFGNKVCQVDITTKTVKEVSDRVQSIIERDEHISDKVDWLESVTGKKDLEKFFVD